MISIRLFGHAKKWAAKVDGFFLADGTYMRVPDPISCEAATVAEAVRLATRAYRLRHMKKLECERCGYAWNPQESRKTLPKKCPRCDNPWRYSERVRRGEMQLPRGGGYFTPPDEE